MSRIKVMLLGGVAATALVLGVGLGGDTKPAQAQQTNANVSYSLTLFVFGDFEICRVRNRVNGAVVGPTPQQIAQITAAGLNVATDCQIV